MKEFLWARRSIIEKPETARQTIGSFMEVLPLQIVIGEQDTFFSLIDKVRGEAVEVRQNGEYAISNSNNHSNYSVFFNFIHVSFAAFADQPVTQEWLHGGHSGDPFSLHVHDFGQAGTFALHFDLRDDIFDESQRAVVMEHFLQTLDAFLADPRARVAQISLLTARERQKLADEFNLPSMELPAGQTVVSLFASQAHAHPERPAVVFHAESLSYAELNTRANQLAHHLRSLAVGPEAVVGICLSVRRR